MRAILVAAVLSVFVYAALAAFTDAKGLAASLRDFPLDTLIWDAHPRAWLLPHARRELVVPHAGSSDIQAPSATPSTRSSRG